MPGDQLNLVLRHVRSLVGPSVAADTADADLLERFAVRHEESAFAAVLERYGPLVLGVCRRVLEDAHDAEDAFQATFLVLARRAASIRRGASLASWLHGAAYRVALEARRRAARRRAHERQAAARPPYESPADEGWADLRPVLDEELRRLPEKYRAPLVLHYLEGKTKQEAARQLGWAEGTVSGRLDRARQLLRRRLVRRGVTLSAGALAAALSTRPALGTLSPALRAATLRAALGFASGSAAVPAQAVSLAEAALRSLLPARLKLGASLLLIGVLGAGTGLATRLVRAAPGPDTEPPGAPPALALKEEAPPPEPPAPEEGDEFEKPGRKAQAVEQLQALSPERWMASWKEDLDATGQPAGVVLRQQVRKLGLTLETTPAQERALAQPLFLKLRGRGRLELVEEVCGRAALYPVYPGGAASPDAWDRTVHLKEGPRPRPVAFAGPFLVEVREVKEFVPTATGELPLRFLAVGLPPAVGLPLSNGKPITINQVAGPRGQDLIDTGRQTSWTGTEAYVGFDVSQYVPLKGLLRGVTAIRTVEGNLRVPITTRVESSHFGKLEPGVSEKADGVTVTLRDITPSKHLVIINGKKREWQDFDFRFQGADLFRLEFVAHGAAGNLLHCERHIGGQVAKGEGYHVIGYSRPASITAKVLADLRHVDFPFRLENVPLPAHERMPERLEPTAFPGHDEPVAIEVNRILPDEHPAAVELRVVNHSNKDIRNLHLRLVYPGPQGQPLNEWPTLRKDRPGAQPDVPVLVARDGTEVFRASVFALPRETKAVRPVVERVEFTDATDWKPPNR